MNIPTAAELRAIYPPFTQDMLEADRAVKALIHGLSTNTFTTIDGEHNQWVRVPSPPLSSTAIDQLTRLGYEYITTYTYVCGEEFVNYAIRIAPTPSNIPNTTSTPTPRRSPRLFAKHS